MRISAILPALGALKRISLKETVRVTVLVLVMLVLWCKVYDVTSLSTLKVPGAYGGDSLWNLGLIKAYRDGEVTPFVFQNVRSLDAPFRANWNDYPTSEKMLPYCVGVVARFIGLIPAFNLAGLMAMVLAALAFYITCRILDYQWMFSFVGGLMFGFSHYMSARLLAHLTLNYYWHVPFCLLITWWCFDSRDLPIRSDRWWFAVAVGALTGFQAIYYAFLFWQFLAFAALGQGLRRNKSKVISVISIAAISVGCTALMAASHVVYRILHGPNSFVVQRSLANLQLYGLQLPELFLPPFHRWKAFFDFGQTHYFRVSLLQGEMGSPYLGILGIVGFVWLIGFGVVRLLQGRPQAIPLMFWQSVWIILFSLVGGINLLVGVSGLQLFRATNRFSVVLLCLALFFLIRQLGRICPRKYQLILASLLLIFGLWDILPPFVKNPEVRFTQSIVTSDRKFVQIMERAVPPGTMVFQAPVMDFPEVVPHLAITDYTYLRPYLYSRSLHFSYGADKGRALETWQHDVDNLPPRQMADKLEHYGFGAIVIDRKGYADGAALMIDDLESSGRKVIERDEIGEFIAVGLHPRTQVVSPDIPPFPGSGFYGWEGDWRKGASSWSQGNATLVLTNDSGRAIEKQYTFILSSLSKRTVTIVTPQEATTVELGPGKPKTFGPVTLQLPPGETRIRFDTDAPAVPAGGQDPRQVAFSLALVPEPSSEPVPVLGACFYGWEGDWRKGAHSWSRGAATLILNNATPKTIQGQYSFLLNTTSERHVSVITPEATQTVELRPGHPLTVGPFDLRLVPGQTPIRFETDRPPVMAGPGDPRKIAFSMVLLPQGSESKE